MLTQRRILWTVATTVVLGVLLAAAGLFALRGPSGPGTTAELSSTPAVRSVAAAGQSDASLAEPPAPVSPAAATIPAPAAATVASPPTLSLTRTPESPTPVPTSPPPTATRVPMVLDASKSPGATATPVPRATGAEPTRQSVASPTRTPARSRQAAAAAPAANAAQAMAAVHPQVPRLVLGNYFGWYDGDQWGACNLSGGDQPSQPYDSDDPAAMARQVRMALDAGLNGFTAHWFAPGERTDRNFAALLGQSQGTGFQSTVVFGRHFWPGSPAPTQDNVAEALRYIVEHYGPHPNFLRIDGKPVIFFTDMYRVPRATGQSAQAAWAAIRGQADPQGRAWWIAEGLDPSYLEVFDGLFVYKITHATSPDAYRSDSRWAAAVRQWEKKTGKPKLWIGTLTPGWDDTRAGCKADVRVPAPAHKRDRAGSAFYRATFDAALASRPDILWIHSFNEWVEGTYIEPSVLYGDKYMQITRELAQRFKN